MPLTPHPTPAPSLEFVSNTEFSPSHDATHARLVSALVHLLFALGFRSIHTVSPPLPSAPDDASHRPDLIARSGHNTRSLFAVETTTSLRSERATQRLLTLASEAEESEFWVAVPSEARPAALRYVRELEIPARVIGV